MPATRRSSSAQPVERGGVGAGLGGPGHVVGIGGQDLLGPLLDEVGGHAQGIVPSGRGGPGQDATGRLGASTQVDEG